VEKDLFLALGRSDVGLDVDVLDDRPDLFDIDPNWRAPGENDLSQACWRFCNAPARDAGEPLGCDPLKAHRFYSARWQFIL
jgi:hypothetical protein